MPTKTEAIKRFLIAKTHPDLAALYSPDMEIQVNVAQDGGTRVDGDYKGRTWHGWTDGITTWKPFRIPWNANTEPSYSDSEMSYDLSAHVEAIGMTGWDWANQVSRWVAFDFDAITGHSVKHNSTLSTEELKDIQKIVATIPWVTLRRSTGGNGLHLYVFIEPEPTRNHNEHAALARAILGQLSALTGYDFSAKVDVCGGNMWVWHRKMVSNYCLELLKQGEILTTIPANWQEHVKVVQGRARKVRISEIDETHVDAFEQLAGQRPKIALDSVHNRLISFLQDTGAVWWWEPDFHMLVTHTCHLQAAHDQLSLKGFFKTSSSHTSAHNCFCFPIRNGAWIVRRYTPGVSEHESWSQDGQGWTRSYLNREPTLHDVCRTFRGVEDPKGGFMFTEAEVAARSLAAMGINIVLQPKFTMREAKLKDHKDGRIVVEIERKESDSASEMEGWLPKGKIWTCIVGTSAPTISTAQESEVGEFDDIIRHLVTESDEDYGWVVNSDSQWRTEPFGHVRVALSSMGASSAEASTILGSSVFKPWKLVNMPFQPEYPGDRKWNKNAARFRFAPSQDTDALYYPTWSGIMKHTGSGLDEAIEADPWCQLNGILTGADYLKCWIAGMFQHPTEPLPYLFLYGPQNCGKSILHEALSLLLTHGYARADNALTNNSGFNGELEGAIVCVVEETDLRRNISAYNRIKDWVTARELPIHAKNKTPYHTPNTTHWIQCANDHRYCPIFKGDTRITMCYVPELDPLEIIPKRRMITQLEKEAPDFIAEIMRIELPESHDRLLLPVIDTADKGTLADQNRSPLQMFIDDHCELIPGNCLKFSDFHDKFQSTLDPTDASYWTKIRLSKELPPQIPKGREHSTGQFYLGNICWKGKADPNVRTSRYVIVEGYLELAHDPR